MEINNIAELRRNSFAKNISQGTLFRLKGEPPFDSDTFHVFIILNRDWQEGELLIIENGTTQIVKRYHEIENLGLDPDKVTVPIRSGKYSFFSEHTMIDCSNIHEVDIDDIHFENSDRFLYIDGKLDEEDLQKVITAVKSNPTISGHIKGKI